MWEKENYKTIKVGIYFYLKGIAIPYDHHQEAHDSKEAINKLKELLLCANPPSSFGICGTDGNVYGYIRPSEIVAIIGEKK